MILLDVDDTLLDFDACSRQAVRHACKVTGIPWSPRLFDTFQDMNAGFWQQIETGHLTLKELWKIRWNRIFERLGIQGNGPAFEQAFHQALDVTHEPVKGAAKLLEQLTAQGYSLYAASNGRQKQQETRLELAGLSCSLKGVFTSEAAGVNKPDRAFFDYVMKQLQRQHPDIKPEQVLMIGDSLTADIQGAREYGMQALWFCRNGRPGAGCTELDQIPGILNRQHTLLPDRFSAAK